MSPYPLRTIIDWRAEPSALGTHHVAVLSCGHRTDFGRGQKPSATEWPCVQCAPDAAVLKAKVAA